MDKINKKRTRKILKGSNLIALDVDGTVLSNDMERERAEFVDTMAPALTKLAKRCKICFITGNGIQPLATRLVEPLIDALFKMDRISLISQFHFFANGAGIYFHFPDPKDFNYQADTWRSEILDPIQGISPNFISYDYASFTSFNYSEVSAIGSLSEKTCEMINGWYMESFSSDNFPIPKATFHIRKVETCRGNLTSQITIKPVMGKLPDQNATDPVMDYRFHIVDHLNGKLHMMNLDHVVATPGGRTSIDITYRMVNKLFALRYLSNLLNIGFKNIIFIGDEFKIGGNDLIFSTQDEIISLAVNADKSEIPESPYVFPIRDFSGADATLAIIKEFISFFKYIVKKFTSENKLPDSGAMIQWKKMILEHKVRFL